MVLYMKKVSNTASRLKEIMKEKGLKQTDILNKAIPYCKKYGVKLGRNNISQYISGEIEPGQAKLIVLAEALETNEMWLMGLDIPNVSKEILESSIKKDK